MDKLQLGVTLYSYTQEYLKGTMTLEDCFKEASKTGATGIELVGTQMIKSYPYLTDEVLGEIRSYCSKYNLEVVCYGANTDTGLRADRDLNEAELFHQTIMELEIASKLGAKIMRVQFLLSPQVLEKLAPYAELYDVKMGIEIHNPETPSTPKIREYLEVIKRVGSEYIGFIPDFGAFATKPNKPHWEQAIKDGASEELLQKAAEMRYAGVPRHEAANELINLGANGAVMTAFNGMYGFVALYNEADLEGLAEIMPYVMHFHGKFHFIDENLEEASIPYKDVLRVIKNSGYSGYIVSEYEDQSGPSVIMVDRHIRMVNKYLEELNKE